MIEHIFFDLDNTLWDFRKNSFLALEKLFNEQEIEKKFGVSFEEFYPVYSEINESLWELFRDHQIEADELKWKRFSDAFQHFGITDTYLPQFFYTHYLDTITDFNHLVPGTEDLLDYLSDNYRLHILTNGFFEVTHRKINHSALSGKFQTITSAEELNTRKPNPSIFEFALQKANAKKENTAFIGDDWLADAVGARDFGIRSIFLDLLNENPEGDNIEIVSSLSEVKNLF